jgi:hypothetical protein
MGFQSSCPPTTCKHTCTQQHMGLRRRTSMSLSAQAAHVRHPMRAFGCGIKLTPRGRSGHAKVEHSRAMSKCSISHGISTWDTETRIRQDSSRRKQVPHELSLTRCKPGLIKVCTTLQKTHHARSSEPSKGQVATPVAKTHTRNRHRRHNHHDENGVTSCPAAGRSQGRCPCLMCGSSLLRRVCP